MRVSIESEGSLREALDGLAHGQDKKGLFDGRLESVEAGCKVRLKLEYREKFEGCVAFLRAEIGKMYVALIEKGEGDVRQWLEDLKSLYIK